MNEFHSASVDTPTNLITPKLKLGQIFLRFLRFGCMAWGGPVAQIAMLKQELVEEEKWVTKEHFNRALALYQVLPGPEAHEMCVWFGMKVGGRIGGFLAGLGFMLPGFLLMLLMIWGYTQFGVQSDFVQIIFQGIQAAVVAMIGFAVWRIGKHAVINKTLLAIAILSGILLFAGLSFWMILPFAGLFYAFSNQTNKTVAVLMALLPILLATWMLVSQGVTFPLQNKFSSTTPSIAPIASNLFDVFFTGLKGGLLTFGGAYTAIPFIQQDAVEKYGWMSSQQFLDGIALSGMLPAPLVIFATFIGYFGGGWAGALLITLGMFLPAFTFTLVGDTYMERLITNPALHRFLDGITASVIGLIGLTALQLFLSIVHEPLDFFIFGLALFLLLKVKYKYLPIFLIVGAGAIALLWEWLKV